ncbi:MAG: hypothetical protein AABZ60_23745, partial [Planctomycetota bacterium]
MKSIQVIDLAGVSYPAEFGGFLKKMDGVLLECGALDFPVKVSEQTELTLENTYYHVSLKGKDYQRNIAVQPAPISQYMDWSEASPQYGFSLPLGLIFNEFLEFVGFTLPGFSALQSLSSFYEGILKENQFMDPLQWSMLKKDLQSVSSTYQGNIKISFRKRPSRSYGDSVRGLESEGYGYLVKPGFFFLPQNLTLEDVESIKSIEICFQEKIYEGQFAGLFKEWGGFLIQVAMEPMTSFLFSEETFANPNTFLLSLHSIQRFGNCENKIYFTHQTPLKYRGYKGILCSEITHQVQPGNLYFAWDEALEKFHFVGMGLTEKKYENSVEYTDDRRFQTMTSIFLDAALLQKRLTQHESYLDPLAKIKTILESKELAWLGVEFQFMNKALAEMLKVQDMTKNGNVGFLIKSIYEQSPAERMGLQ